MVQVAELAAAAEKLYGSSKEFAYSLLAAKARWGKWSPKQEMWAAKLVERAAQPQKEAEKLMVGSCAGLYKLFEGAKSKLKWPAIEIEVSGIELKIKPAGQKSKYAGQLIVSSFGKFGEAKFYGAVSSEGVYSPSQALEEAKALQVAEALAAFAEAPAELAAAYGKKSGMCCFCVKPLSTEESLGVGYGPVCAKHYGLPWGKKALAEVAAF